MTLKGVLITFVVVAGLVGALVGAVTSYRPQVSTKVAYLAYPNTTFYYQDELLVETGNTSQYSLLSPEGKIDGERLSVVPLTCRCTVFYGRTDMLRGPLLIVDETYIRFPPNAQVFMSNPGGSIMASLAGLLVGAAVSAIVAIVIYGLFGPPLRKLRSIA